ncbi:MAG: LLM class F420-dependent oxidoreductase, partial [Actinomycetota bacterium]|nr:LLM class F420-dependent oxidoreductase [Actinomycetota bacterium]
PILIGGSGEKKTLRMVAQYAQACNLFGGPDVEHKLDVLRGHCAALGRDYDDIEKTVMMQLDPGENGENVDKILEQLAAMAKLGIQHVHTGVPNAADLSRIRVFGEKIIPAAASL